MWVCGTAAAALTVCDKKQPPCHTPTHTIVLKKRVSCQFLRSIFRARLGGPASALAPGAARSRARVRRGPASGAARRRRVCVARYLLSAHVARCCPGLPRDCVLWRSPVRRFFVVYFRYGVDVALFLH